MLGARKKTSQRVAASSSAPTQGARAGLSDPNELATDIPPCERHVTKAVAAENHQMKCVALPRHTYSGDLVLKVSGPPARLSGAPVFWATTTTL